MINREENIRFSHTKVSRTPNCQNCVRNYQLGSTEMKQKETHWWFHTKGVVCMMSFRRDSNPCRTHCKLSQTMAFALTSAHDGNSTRTEHNSVQKIYSKFIGAFVKYTHQGMSIPALETLKFQ